MNVLTLQSTYGGLLHDTGKAVYRAGGQRGSHSEQGYQFLHGVLPGAGWAPALDCVRYHHAAALRGAAKALPADSPAYIVYLADDLSAAADRREVEGESSSFRRDLPLDSVFTHLNGSHPGWMMPAQPQDGSLKLPRQQQPLSASVYADAVRKLKECLATTTHRIWNGSARTVGALSTQSLILLPTQTLSARPKTTTRTCSCAPQRATP